MKATDVMDTFLYLMTNEKELYKSYQRLGFFSKQQKNISKLSKMYPSPLQKPSGPLPNPAVLY